MSITVLRGASLIGIRPSGFVRSNEGRIAQMKLWREILEALAEVDETAKRVLEGKPLMI